MGVAAADFNNDGWVDLYVTNFGHNQMWRNNGDGTFTDVTRESGTDVSGWSCSAAFLDYDRDGWLDLFVGNYVDFRFSDQKKCLAASGAEDYCGPLSFNPLPNRLFRNRRDGTFEDVTASSRIGSEFGGALGVICADFNGDGWVDIYVANDKRPNQLWVNQRDGTFKNDGLVAGCALDQDGIPQSGMGVDAGDVLGRGLEDLAQHFRDIQARTETVAIDLPFIDEFTSPSGDRIFTHHFVLAREHGKDSRERVMGYASIKNGKISLINFVSVPDPPPEGSEKKK